MGIGDKNIDKNDLKKLAERTIGKNFGQFAKAFANDLSNQGLDKLTSKIKSEQTREDAHFDSETR